MLLIGPLLTVAVCVLALAAGGRAEREAAVVTAAGLALWIATGAVRGRYDQLTAALSDVALLGGFLALAMLRRRLWLYLEVAVFFALLGAHVASDQSLGIVPGFRVVINALNLAGLAVFAVAIVVAWRRERPVPVASAG